MRLGLPPTVLLGRGIERQNPARLCDGVALVLVLGFLVLIAALIVAFFTSVTTELAGSKSYASGVTARQLADSAVHISMGTVAQATASIKPGDPNALLAWASQPGMIRTYNNDATGSPYAYYKLYSSDSTVVNNFPFSTNDYKADWNANPALYTDLNAPAIVNGVATRYPIVDPRASANYPTLNANPNGIKGFSISTTAPVDNSATPPNPVPMPVQWIYVLNDGTMTTPTNVDGAGKVASWLGSSNAPTAANPIVGRIAYWTDDDTCKINVNTAAGDVWKDTLPAPGVAGNPGSYWDLPRTTSTFDKNFLAKNQPAKREFQRYPGHPATTYLSAALPFLTADGLYQIAPRVSKGGSNGGTVATASSATTMQTDNDRLYASVDELLFAVSRADVTRRDVNSLVTVASLSPTRFFLTTHSRAPEMNLFGQPRVAIWPVSATDDANHRTIFDSTIARCATLNDTNLPNASPYRFYFQRGDYKTVPSTGSDSSTADLPATPTIDGVGRNRALISYLRKLTGQSIPGFGGSFLDLNKYPVDRDQILTEIFDYIRSTNGEDLSMFTANPNFIAYAKTPQTMSNYGVTNSGSTGIGQIVPITDNVHTDSNSKTLRGFGRFPTVREASIMFVGVGQTDKNDPKLKSLVSGQPPIDAGKTRVQAVFSLSFFDPSQGFGLAIPEFYVNIKGLDTFALNNIKLGYSNPISATPILVRYVLNNGGFGGYVGHSTFVGAGLQANISPSIAKPSIVSPVSDTVHVDVLTDAGSLSFTGGIVTVEIMGKSRNVLQTLQIPFDNVPSLPIPTLAPRLRDTTLNQNLESDYRVLTAATPVFNTTTGDLITPAGRFNGGCAIPINTNRSAVSKNWVCGRDVIRSVEANTDYRTIAALTTVDRSYFTPMADYYGTTSLVHSIADSQNGSGPYPSYNTSAGMTGALVRDAKYGLVPPAKIQDLAETSERVATAPPLATTDTETQIYATQSNGRAGYNIPAVFGKNSSYSVPANGVYSGTNMTGDPVSTYPPGDWDTGMSTTPDGPYINKADEGTNATLPNVAYYESLSNYQSSGTGTFSPNRIMPSPVMFGSLPTGVFSARPWQTLLFRPDPGGVPQHVGARSPCDYLLLDLFNMPIVEPYPISDPFSTAGKINMNYQIVPFTYITRSTGIQAVLKPEQLLAIPTTDSNSYKTQSPAYTKGRLPINIDQTLVGFQNRFDAIDPNEKSGVFKSASEICSLWLVPQSTGINYSNMPSFWADNLLTGDNVRERPYADIYPRLTTQSNTYTVHYRVQSLKTLPSSTAGTWTEGKDLVTSEYRGSSTFERYLDTNDTTIPDYATASNPKTIDNFYKFRVIETKQFTP